MRSFFILIVLFIFTSCDSDIPLDSNLPSATGSYSNILIVHDQNQWSKELKANSKSIFSKEVAGILQNESEFEIIDVPAKSFSSLLKRQRQILLFSISSQHKNATFSMKENAFANGQKYVQIKAKTQLDALSVLKQKAEVIFNAFNANRKDGLQKRLSRNLNQEAVQLIKNRQAISVIIPRDFKVDTLNYDFSYLFSKEKKPCEVGRNNFCYIQNGLMIYTFPYTTSSIFDAQFLASKRDSLTRIYVKGEASLSGEETYMKIENKFPISAGPVTFNNNFGFEMKGWWTKENGIMGGPFVNLSFVDTERNRVICIDAFSFAPNFTKRDIVKELEAICWSAFPM